FSTVWPCRRMEKSWPAVVSPRWQASRIPTLRVSTWMVHSTRPLTSKRVVREIYFAWPSREALESYWLEIVSSSTFKLHRVWPGSTPSDSPDNSFSPGLSGTLFGLTVQADGKI